MSNFSRLLSFALLTVLLFTVVSCDDDRLFRIDFSSAPDPVSLQGITPDTLANGILIFNVRTGDTGFGAVTERDVAEMKFTIWLRNGNGPIRDSSYRGGQTMPITVNIQGRTTNLFSISTGTYFPKIVAGMYEDGFRTAMVPPAVSGLQDTLRYDLELIKIID
jgi:hypothetical protein